jgi:outer membrane protein OmpA-like peptidoglycan-associated protein
VNGTPATVPTAPRSVQATRVEASVTVTWTAPASNGGAAITRYVVVATPGGAECVATATSCTFGRLPVGLTYTFAVSADNTTTGLPATGAGPAAASAQLVVSGKPGVPEALHVGGSDRSLVLSFRAPTDNGGARVTGYQVSLDGGRTWRAVHARGTAAITVTIPGVVNGATYPVRVRALNGNGIGAATDVASYRVPAWFGDPVKPASRKHEVAVPSHPARFRGRAVATKANGRSHNGTSAYPVGRLHERQLQRGQAASLGADALFRFDSAKLTPAGKAAVRALALSLRYVHVLTCEGYSDFGGRPAHQKALSAHRARVVCAALRARGVHARMHIRAYGGSRPVVVGGTPADRAANRRVIILVNR